MPLSLLVVDDDQTVRETLVEFFDALGHVARGAATATEGRQAVAAHAPDVVLVDLRLPDASGLTLFEALRADDPELGVIFLTGHADVPTAVEAMRRGALDFLEKPVDLQALEASVARAAEMGRLRREVAVLRARDAEGHATPAGSLAPSLARLIELAARNDDAPVLIQGETGTGKELLARALHYNSSRRTSPLMVQNCGGMPDELLQSELFGHERGAFTGAISDRLGLFRAADGGTVFLDEISEVSPSFQVSLLRFLQEGEVKPLGSDKTETANVRIVAASNRPLKALAAAGKFRHDLYFRLRGFELEVPPLRDRPDDIPALAEFFAAKHSDAIGRKILGISAGALEKLLNYGFPGNVRELENEIRRMVALAKDGEYLTTDTMTPAILAATPRPPRVNGFMPEGVTLKEKVESLEKQLVGEVLSRHRWNQSRAANELGLSRVGLANKIKRYGLNETS